MARNGFGFFYNKLGLSIDDLSFYYNFNNSGGSVEVVSGDSSLSGIIGSQPDFWSSAGSGYLSSGGVSVDNFDGVRESDWTFLVVPERTHSGSEVLFSTMDSGQSSGIVVSINDFNNLMVITKDSNGYLYSESFSLSLSDKNILGFVKAANSLSIVKYDPSNLTYTSESKIFPNSCLLNNFEQFSIGHSASDLVPDFSGYIDEAAFINTVLNSKQIQTLSSGFVRDGYSTSQVAQTGFSFGYAHCEGNEYISGLDPSIVYKTVETPSSIDFDFMKTLKKSGLKYSECSQVNYFTTIGFVADPILYPNQDIFFDLVNGYFRSSLSWNFGDTLFFYNGELMDKVADYTYSNNLLIRDGSTFGATGVLDAIPHSYNTASIVSGDLASGSAFSSSNPNAILFLNGGLLISGVDYEESGGNYVSLNNVFETTSGSLTEIVFTGLEIVSTTTTNALNVVDYYDNTVLPFINRRRLPLSKFMQLGSMSMNFNDGQVSCFSGDLIYGNEGNYFDE